jgi:uncharacterized protein with NRDE domain
VCTVIVAWQCFPDAPLIVAANRDELYRRPSDPPLLLQPDPPRWGGRDRVAGGTWLAVDPAGRIGAVTNRHPDGVVPARDATRSTRGRLPLDALVGSDTDALAWMTSLEPGDYNPVNLLYASPAAALWTSLDDRRGRRTTPLTPGIHVLAEQDLDDPADPKASGLLGLARAAQEDSPDAETLVSRLREVLRSHEAPAGGLPACIHGELHGTVSSATVRVSSAGVRFDHAEGPPCTTAYETVI